MRMDRQAQLVAALLRKTLAGQIEWVSVSDDIFLASIGNNAVQVHEDMGSDRFDYVVSILNENGEIVERFSDSDLKENTLSDPPDNYQSYFSLLSDLYGAGRRSAMGADQVLSDLLKNLT